MGPGTYHELHHKYDPARRGVWRVIASYTAQFLPPCVSSVLELGAGYCDWIRSMPGDDKVVVDIWPGVASYAPAGARVIVHDLGTGLACLEAQAFDVILASNLLEHLEMDEVSCLLGAVHAHLNERGRLLLIQPNFRYAYRNYFDDHTHRTVFTHVSLSRVVTDAGLHVIHMEPKFAPYSTQGRLPQSPWLVRIYLGLPSFARPLAGQMFLVAEK